MSGGVLSMSGKERERAFVVRRCTEGRLRQWAASQRLGVCVGQFKRLVQAWRRRGDGGLISRQRGRRSHWRLRGARRAEIGRVLKEQYEGFGPAFAAEKLLERDGIKVGVATVRQIQIGLKLWRPSNHW